MKSVRIGIALVHADGVQSCLRAALRQLRGHVEDDDVGRALADMRDARTQVDGAIEALENERDVRVIAAREERRGMIDLDERGIPATARPVVYTAAASNVPLCPKCKVRLNAPSTEPWCGACGWFEPEQKAKRR